MARYPVAFELWYKKEVAKRAAEFDAIIIRMRDDKEVKTLAEGESRLRKMLFLDWSLVGSGVPSESKCEHRFVGYAVEPGDGTVETRCPECHAVLTKEAAVYRRI